LPTLMMQVRTDPTTTEQDTLDIFNAFSNDDKTMRWIDDTSDRYEAYRFFTENPEELVAWFKDRL